MVYDVDDIDFEVVLLSVSHKDGVKVVGVLRVVLQILLLDHTVRWDAPRGPRLGLELFTRQEHGRLGDLFKDHLVAMLDIVRHHVDEGGLRGVGVAGARLTVIVKVGIRGTDDVRVVSLQQLHVWLDVGKLDTA